MPPREPQAVRDVAELIAEGVRASRAGALDRAIHAFRLAREHTEQPELLADAYTHEADVLRAKCAWEEATAAARRAQAVAWEADLASQYLEALNAEANILSARGQFEEARPILERVVAGSTSARLRGIALQNLGTIHAQSGQVRTAERAFTESLRNFEAIGYTRGVCIALNNLGRLALDVEDRQQATPLLERALGIARDIEDPELAALTGLNLGWALCETGELDQAQDLAMAALGYFAGCDNRWREIECFRLIGDVNVRCEDYANAERCYTIALSFAEQIRCQPEIEATKQRLVALAARPRPPRVSPGPMPIPDFDGGNESSAPLS